jgi:hypothetical protein
MPSIFLGFRCTVGDNLAVNLDSHSRMLSSCPKTICLVRTLHCDAILNKLAAEKDSEGLSAVWVLVRTRKKKWIATCYLLIFVARADLSACGSCFKRVRSPAAGVYGAKSLRRSLDWSLRIRDNVPK